MYSYLALGDSYTIGEGIALQQSFPYYIYRKLNILGFATQKPYIIAKTGRTADELLENITKEESHLLSHYDIITLLVGVNNQYRSYDIARFQSDFEKLLAYSLHKSNCVVVLNIPNWGITPFNLNKDKTLIGDEIIMYNNIIASMTTSYKAGLIDIHTICDHINYQQDLCLDGLHYSGLMYDRWANQCISYILKYISYQ